MLNCHIPGAVRGVGKGQGFYGIAVKYTKLGGHPSVMTCWEPTPEELEALNKGAKIYLGIISERQPPVLLAVGEPIKEDDVG